ncbi:MAG: hypothetical protein ACJ710_01950 [Ornithinibacter sp.]
MTVDLTGQGEPIDVQEPGTHTLVAGDFILGLDTGPVAPPATSTPTATSTSTSTATSSTDVPTSPAPSGPTDPAAPVDVFMDCTLTDEGDPTIDTFEATAAPTPTVTTTVTAEPAASPVRPVVVQTDFAGDDHSSALPLVLGGALMAGGVGAVATGRTRGGSRRH